MADRKDLSQKLGGGSAPGWKDMIPQVERPTGKSKKRTDKPVSPIAQKNGMNGDEKKVRKTYYLRESTITRIQGLADQEHVGISDFVEYALTRFLDMLDEGDIEMKTKSKQVREIVY